MGYQFKGFFAKHSDGLAPAAERQWPSAQIKVLDSPFFGVGLRMPDAMTEQDMEELFLFEKELPAWSSNFPESIFVFVEADCLGGVCLYCGYVCKAGVTLSVQSGEKALSRLLKHLDIELNDNEYFEPFTRAYPW